MLIGACLALLSAFGFAFDPQPVAENTLLVSVKSFGAVGDGRNDDRDAIVRALRSGHAIFFPKGAYVVGSPIDFGALRLSQGWVQPSVTLVGEGAGISRLVFRGRGAMLIGGRTAPTAGGYEQSLNVRQLSFSGTPRAAPKPVRKFGRLVTVPNEFAGTSSDQVGVRWEFSGASVIQASEFRDFDTAISTKFGYMLSIKNNVFHYNGIAILLSEAITTSKIQENIIERNDIGIGLWIATQIDISNNVMQGNYGGADIVSYNWNSQIYISKNYFEASPKGFFHAGDSEGDYVSNNYIFEENKGLAVELGPLAYRFQFNMNRLQSFNVSATAREISMSANTDDNRNGLAPFKAFTGAGANALLIVPAAHPTAAGTDIGMLSATKNKR